MAINWNEMQTLSVEYWKINRGTYQYASNKQANFEEVQIMQQRKNLVQPLFELDTPKS